MDLLESYRRAQDGFDAVLATVPADKWDAPSACTEWSIGDVAGHVIWGQEALRHWATGQAYANTTGAPGAPHPAAMAGPDPVATWRAARAATSELLTEAALGRTVTLPGLGEIPLAAVVTLLITDHLAHTWDIANGLGLEVRLPAELIPDSFAWARQNVRRAPGFFGPEREPPAGADEQARWLAYLGRAA